MNDMHGDRSLARFLLSLAVLRVFVPQWLANAPANAAWTGAVS
jgi:hypothetical protein